MNPEAQRDLQFSLESYSSYIQHCTIVHFRNHTKSCVHIIKGTFSDSNNNKNNNNNNNNNNATRANHQAALFSIGCSTHCRVFSVIPGLHLLNTSDITLSPTLRNQTYLQTLPGIPWRYKIAFSLEPLVSSDLMRD